MLPVSSAEEKYLKKELRIEISERQLRKRKRMHQHRAKAFCQV